MLGTNVIIDALEEADRQIVVQAGQKILYVVPVLSSVAVPTRRDIILAGDGATAEIVGLWLGANDDVLDLQLNTTHAAPNTLGRTVFKAVLGGRASLTFNGMIKIDPGAQGSNDFLQQDSLMLSDEAKANAVPGLEIEANDVKASHGATAKPVDVEQMFYLMSRGLSAAQAEAMVVTGFIAPIMKLLTQTPVPAKINAVLRHNFKLTDVFA